MNHDAHISRIGLDYENWESAYGRVINGAVTDNGDTTYTGVMTIYWAGEYTITIQVSGVDVPDYPATLTVVPGPIDPSSCIVKDLLPEKIPAGS